MTLVLCLNYGDKIYVATDSLMTSRRPDGSLHPEGYRLKLYPVPHCNAVMAFSGSMTAARAALERISRYAAQRRPTERALFQQLPSLISNAVSDLPHEQQKDIDILFAALQPKTKAYEREVYPGAGIPPRTYCAIWSWRKNRIPHISSKEGHAKHVLSGNGTKFVAEDPRALMDILVTGSGGKEIVPTPRHYHYYYKRRHQPNDFMMRLMGTALSGFFTEIPIERSGVGGEYQVALITEHGVDLRISLSDEPVRPVKVEFKHDAFVVTDLETGDDKYIQSIWDRRLVHEIREMGHLL